MTNLWSGATPLGHWEGSVGETAKQILQTRLIIETEQDVITEIQGALLETAQLPRRTERNE